MKHTMLSILCGAVICVHGALAADDANDCYTHSLKEIADAATLRSRAVNDFSKHRKALWAESDKMSSTAIASMKACYDKFKHPTMAYALMCAYNEVTYDEQEMKRYATLLVSHSPPADEKFVTAAQSVLKYLKDKEELADAILNKKKTTSSGKVTAQAGGIDEGPQGFVPLPKTLQ